MLNFKLHQHIVSHVMLGLKLHQHHVGHVVLDFKLHQHNVSHVMLGFKLHQHNVGHHTISNDFGVLGLLITPTHCRQRFLVKEDPKFPSVSLTLVKQ